MKYYTVADMAGTIDFEARITDASVARNQVLTRPINAYVWIQCTLVNVFVHRHNNKGNNNNNITCASAII